MKLERGSGAATANFEGRREFEGSLMREGEREREEGDRERERESVCEGWPAEAEGERYENAGGEPAMCGVGDKTLHPTAVDRP